MEELLLLGAGAVAVLVAAPLIGGLINPELGKSIADSGKGLLKEGIKFGMDTAEGIQVSAAEVGEAWNDIIAEAKAEREQARNSQTPPQTIEIAADNPS